MARRLRLVLRLLLVAATATLRRRHAGQHLIDLVDEAGYLRVLGDRPVIYVGFIEDSTVEKNWGGPAGLRKVIDQLRDELVVLHVREQG